MLSELLAGGAPQATGTLEQLLGNGGWVLALALVFAGLSVARVLRKVARAAAVVSLVLYGLSKAGLFR